MAPPMHGHTDVSEIPPAKPSRFLRNIRRFRTKGEARRANAKGRENTRLLESLQEHLHALECVEKVGDRIELLARQLIAEAPGFHLARRLFDGRYVVELAVKNMRTDEHGSSVRELSRLAFMMEIQGEEGLNLECHATVRDHDLPNAHLETVDCAGGELSEVDTFLDDHFLTFARAYYAGVDSPATGLASL